MEEILIKLAWKGKTVILISEPGLKVPQIPFKRMVLQNVNISLLSKPMDESSLTET